MIKLMTKQIVARLLPDSMKTILFRAIFSSMSEQHKDATRARYEIASIDMSLRNLKRLGFCPRHIVDVGAYAGYWTQMVKQVYPDADVLMIEAQAKKEAGLRQMAANYPGSVTYKMKLLGPKEEPDACFYELEAGSSVLPEQSNINRRIVHYPMDTLDNVVEQCVKAPIEFLKLDVQGYELEVLRGGTKTLQSAEVVLMEVALLGVNKGAPLLHEVVQFMKERSFVAYDICSFIRRPLDNALWQTDVLFVKETSALLSNQTFGR